MQPQPSGRPAGEVGRHIGRRRGCRVKFTAAIGKLGGEKVPRALEPDAHGVLHSFASAMPDGVGEQLFESEVKIELGFAAERIFLAKPGDLVGEAFELREVAVKCEFNAGQKRRLCHSRGAAFNQAARIAPGAPQDA